MDLNIHESPSQQLLQSAEVRQYHLESSILDFKSNVYYHNKLSIRKEK